MRISVGTTLYALFRSLTRDLNYVLVACLFPAVLSYAVDLFRDGFLPWPLMTFLGLCDASATSAWMGGAKRSYLIINSPRSSIATSMTVMGLIVWVARVMMLRTLRYLAMGVDPILDASSLNVVLMNSAAGVALTSLFFLMIAVLGYLAPWLFTAFLFLASLLLGASVWVSELCADPMWQNVTQSASEPFVALAGTVVFVLFSILINLLSAEVFRVGVTRKAIDPNT